MTNQKQTWYSVPINLHNILHETGKATLFKMSQWGDYKGFVFWHPSKLVKFSEGSYSAKILLTKDFRFHLKKTKGKRIEEVEIGAEEFARQFGFNLNED